MFIFRVIRIRLKLVALAIIFLSLAFIGRSVQVAELDFPAPLEQVTTEEKVMALTINVDWGEEYLPTILDILEQYNAQATFFVTGRWAQKNPDLMKAMAAKGHLIGNHGYYHSHPDQVPVAKTKEELTRTEAVIKDITGKVSRFYAPPYGERGRNGLIAANELGYMTVLWTLDTIDWRPESTPEVIAQRILDPKVRFGVKPEKKGAIVLMHPKENTVKALPVILERLTAEGFKFISVEKLITFN